MIPTIRIAQLNIGSLLDPDWDRRRHEVVAWLDRLDPDIVCFQEAWQDDKTANTAGWIAERLESRGAWDWRFGGYPFPAPLWPDSSLTFGSAILSRYPIEDHHVDLLPGGSTDDEIFRQIPTELLHVRTAGIDVFSTHLSSAPSWGDQRQRQVRALDEIVRARSGDAFRAAGGLSETEAMPPIVCGDFNAEPDSEEMRFLTSLTMIDGRTTFYQDAWRVGGGEGSGYTQDWRRNPYSARLNVHQKRIDYILVGDPFRRAGGAGRVERAFVAFDEPLTGLFASDHFGVVADIVWPTRSERPALSRS